MEVLAVEYLLGNKEGRVFHLNKPVSVQTMKLAFLDNWGESNFTCVGKIGLFEAEI